VQDEEMVHKENQKQGQGPHIQRAQRSQLGDEDGNAAPYRRQT
jgi:hypothetical protein